MTTTTSATASSSLINQINGKTTVNDKANETSDRFLKLLVTQMQNQDPLNPMDNAQVTSQMAQINTVTGIEKLNTTMGGMTDGFTQMQLMQGTSLIGHQVMIEGNQLAVDSSGAASGGFDLSSKAANVSVDVMDAAGTVLDTIKQSGVEAGRHSFQWSVPSTMSSEGLTFKVTATSGSTAIGSTSLMSDQVDAISNTNGTLNLELRNSGSTAYNKIVAVGS
ncbi:MAG: flagellar hook capping FlgD N-terminal domain-containing protein [Pseudomonadota bacterium]